MQAPSGYRLLERDLFSGVSKFVKIDEKGEFVDVIISQDPTAILDQNKREAFDGKGSFIKRGNWGAKAASIPIGVIYKWREEEGIDVYNPDHADAVRKKLNSGEYAYLRVGNFRI